jgi:hypothetical protein
MDVRRLTEGPQRHFVAAGGSPWGPDGETLLVHETTVEGRPEPDAGADLCLVDDGGALNRVVTTTAWNVREGASPRWLLGDQRRAVAYNVRDGRGFAARVRDLDTGEQRPVAWPLCAVDAAGRGYSIDFTRLARVSPADGYALPEDTPEIDPSPAPAGDGLYAVDVAADHGELVASLDDLSGFAGVDDAGTTHWVRDARPAPDGERVAFRHEWAADPGGEEPNARLFVADPDGNGLRRLAGEHAGAYCWLDADSLLALDHATGQFARHDLSEPEPEAVPELPAGRPDAEPGGDRVAVGTDGALYLADDGADPEPVGSFDGPVRPSWDRDGERICVDAPVDGRRQVHLVEP